MKRFSLITVTFNRRDLLPRLFESLKKQTFRDFEWIICDDGSVDNTNTIIGSFIGKGIEIKSTKQINSGKHVGINKCLELVCGEYVFIVDSDDFLPNNSLEIANKWLKSLESTNSIKKFVGVAGLKEFYNTKETVGSTFSGQYLDCSSLERDKNHIRGDKAEIFKAEVLKKYRFPVFENEKFLPESVVWYRIANDGYIIRWFNEVIYYCEYLRDGLSKTREKYRESFNGQMLATKELITYGPISRKRKLKQIATCGYVCFVDKRNFRETARYIGVNGFLLRFLGFLLFIAKKIRK